MNRTRRNTALAAVAVLVSVLTASLPIGRRASAGAGYPRIYRIKVTIVTTSSHTDLSLLAPAVAIDGKAKVLTQRPGVRASFGTYGTGPLHIEQPVTDIGTRAKGSFVVALTTGGASSLWFRSNKGSAGKSIITIANLNDDSAATVRRFRHRRRAVTSKSFSVATGAIANGGALRGTAPLAPKVYAFYYPWYQLSNWYGGAIARYNVNDHPYDSGDASAIARHISQARAANIDGFISSWFGQETQTDENLQVVFDQLPARGFKVAIYFETFSDEFQSKEDIVRNLAYALDTYGARPQYLRFRNRPVIYLYSTRYVLRSEGEAPNPDYLAVWRDVFRTLRNQGYRFKTVGLGLEARELKVFDGLHLYYVRSTGPLEQKMELIARAYAAVHGGGRRLWGAPVAPGYDDRHIPERSSTQYIARNDGAYYRSQWAAATASYSDQALIISFNEWYETTNIEPNRRWGNQYLGITAKRAQAFKNSR